MMSGTLMGLADTVCFCDPLSLESCGDERKGLRRVPANQADSQASPILTLPGVAKQCKQTYVIKDNALNKANAQRTYKYDVLVLVASCQDRRFY